MAELLRSTSSKPALVKNPSAGSTRKPGRHVAFEVPNSQNRHRSGLSDIDSEIDYLHHGSHRRPFCFSICVWVCLAVFTFTIILLILGITYLAFLQSGMPQVYVTWMNITKLQLQNNQQMDSVIQLGLKISNKNEKLKLLYSPLTVDVISQDVNLGKNKVAGFSQKPQNDTYLDMKMTVNKAKINPDAVKDIKSDMKDNEMLFNVYLSGKIGFEAGSLRMTTVPFLSLCQEVKLADVASVKRPKCDVRMFAFRPSTN